jgi:hypothetical protein
VRPVIVNAGLTRQASGLIVIKAEPDDGQIITPRQHEE